MKTILKYNIFILFWLGSLSLFGQSRYPHIGELYRGYPNNELNLILDKDMKAKEVEISSDTPLSEEANIIMASDQTIRYRVGQLPSRIQIGDRISLTAKDKNSGKTKIFEYKVVQIPKGRACLTNLRSEGRLSPTEMRMQTGIVIDMGTTLNRQRFCILGRCKLYYQPKGQEAQEFDVVGPKFSGKALAAIKTAKSGDRYFFTDIHAKCRQCDDCVQSLGGMSFEIK